MDARLMRFLVFDENNRLAHTFTVPDWRPGYSIAAVTRDGLAVNNLVALFDGEVKGVDYA